MVGCSSSIAEKKSTKAWLVADFAAGVSALPAGGFSSVALDEEAVVDGARGAQVEHNWILNRNNNAYFFR